MSDEADRQFEPSARKLERAREEGQVPKSKEVGGAAGLLIGGLFLGTTGPELCATIVASCRAFFTAAGTGGGDLGAIASLLRESIMSLTWALLPLLLGVMAIGVFATMSQTGFLFSPALILPKAERLSPLKGFAQLFKLGPAVARTLTGLMKLVFVAAAVYSVSQGEAQAIEQAGAGNIEATAVHIAGACLRVLVAGGFALVVLAGVDYAYQRFTFMKQMKMTRAEMQQEAKELDGSPEIKQKRKGMYRELALNRILKEVPNATVVIANPTHVCVALAYDPGVDAAPRVVAKGTDEVALTIRRIARENGVPIIENPPLARALNRKVKVGRRITQDFYGAVAEVLGFVYRIRDRAAARRQGRA